MAKIITKTHRKAAGGFVPPRRRKGLSRRKQRNYHTARWQTFKLFSTLYARGYVITAEFARECGISDRAAQRLMEPFKEDGILTQDEFQQGKWHFNEARHRWNKMFPTGNDAATLAFLYKFSKVFGGEVRENMVHAIERAFMLEADEYPYFMITGRVKSPEESLPFFKKLFAAIMDKNKIKLTYKSGERLKETVAWPVSFIMCDGIWYLGYLLEPAGGKQEMRTLRAGNIQDVETLVETFEKPAWVKEKLQEARNIWFNTERPTRVELEADNDVKEYFQLTDYLPRQKILSEGKDTFRVECWIGNCYEVIPTIMRFMPAVRVVTPGDLRKDVEARARAYLKRH